MRLEFKNTYYTVYRMIGIRVANDFVVLRRNLTFYVSSFGAQTQNERTTSCNTRNHKLSMCFQTARLKGIIGP